MNPPQTTVSAILGSRIRHLREALGWTQTQLADAVNFGSAQIISSIEKGQRELKAWELVKIAKALQVTADALLRGQAQTAAVEWRECSPEVNKEIEARFVDRCLRFKLLEDWLNYQAPKQLSTLQFKKNSPSFEDVEQAAKSMALLMQLGGRPACSLQKTLEEDYGVKIFYEDLGSNGSACSARGPFGFSVLLSIHEAPWRRNFSLAHELFHLLLPDDLHSLGQGRIERLADVFASSLLLPTDPLVEAIARKTRDGKISHVDLIEIAREFAVSTQAMLWRLVNMKRVHESTAEELLKNSQFRMLDRMSFQKWQWQSPQPLPDRYVRFCLAAFRAGKLSTARLAEFLETSLVDLADDIALAGIESEEGVEAELAVG